MKEGVCDFCGKVKQVEMVNTEQLICDDCVKDVLGYSLQNTTKVVDEIVSLAEFGVAGNINPYIKTILVAFAESINVMASDNNSAPIEELGLYSEQFVLKHFPYIFDKEEDDNELSE